MTTSEAQTVFGLIRHGKTEWNQQKRIQGTSDSPLTPEGRKDLKTWLPVLQSYKWNRIIASPLPRVLQTVEILNSKLSLPVEVDHNLREQDWGSWEGLTLAQIKADHPDELQKQINAGWNFTPPAGESRKKVLQRVEQSLHLSAEKWSGQALLIISHQSVMKCILYSILDHNFLPGEKKVFQKNCFHLIYQQQGKLQPVQLNIARKLR